MSAEDINSLDSESGIIATLIHHPEFAFYSEHLMPNHFTRRDNSCIYLAICNLARRGISTVDPYNIQEVLSADEATRRYVDELPIDKLNDLMDMSDVLARDTPEEYKILVGNVLDAAFRRDTLQRLRECQRLCYDRSRTDLRERIYDEIDEIMTEYSMNNETPQYKEIIDEIWAEIQARQKGETEAIEFPFPDLNKYVVMEPGEVICFTGGPKSGKSAMLLTVTVDMLKKGKSVLYIDSEISTKLFTLRILSHLTKIRFSDLRSGDYSEEDARRLDEAVAWLKTRNFIHMYLPIFDENAVYLTAKRAKHLIDIDCIVVDYLKSTNDRDEAFAVYAEMGRFSDTLKNKICGDMGICGLTAAQSTATGKIADSAKIARSVSTVVSITDKTPEEIDEDPDSTKKLRVVFNRNGSQMVEGEWIDMTFHGSTVTYVQAEHQHEILDPF